MQWRPGSEAADLVHRKGFGCWLRTLMKSRDRIFQFLNAGMRTAFDLRLRLPRRANRRGQELAGLRPGAESLPRRLSCALHPRLCPSAISTILTSQVSVAQWHEQIGDATIADGILDRLVRNAHRIELRGESMRKTRSKKPEGKEEKEA